jgi:hypothetical protein
MPLHATSWRSILNGVIFLSLIWSSAGDCTKLDGSYPSFAQCAV